MTELFILMAGGAAGTIARYGLSNLMYRLFGAAFPYGTLAVNLIGCLLIGFLASLSENKFLLSSNMRLLLMIGFYGAFTTFSTFILETANLIKDGEVLRAFMNVLLSVVVGFVVFKIGVILGELL